MKLTKALDLIKEALDEIFKTEVSDVDKLADELEQLISKYGEERALTEDPYYLKKAVLWIITMCSAELRKGKVISQVPAANSKLLDKVYDRVLDNKVDGKFMLNPDDRQIERVLKASNIQGKRLGEDHKFLVVD